MASIEKYTKKNIIYELRHNTRESTRPPSNIDIDPERTQLNESLAPPDRGGAQPNDGEAARAARQYLKERLSEVYCYGRDDLVVAASWVITAPKDFPTEEREAFWHETYNFLNSLYNERNVIQAIIHRDEGLHIDGRVVAGEEHMHYVFIPVVKNDKYNKPNRYGNISGSSLYEEKVCANELITKKHLEEFHPAYQQWLDDHGIHATVHSGVTGGRNHTVDELKRDTLDREIQRLHDLTESLDRENQALRARIEELEHSHNRNYSGSRWNNTIEYTNERSRW